MTELKAIEWQNAFRRTYKGNPMENEANQACDMAVAALEKQIPKKPIIVGDGVHHYDFDGKCPNCGRRLYGEEHHCKCGQALDWSEE